jgi:hypothetical protein
VCALHKIARSVSLSVSDPDPGGQKLPKHNRKSKESSCFEVLDVLFCELKASPVALSSFRDKQIAIFQKKFSS